MYDFFLCWQIQFLIFYNKLLCPGLWGIFFHKSPVLKLLCQLLKSHLCLSHNVIVKLFLLLNFTQHWPYFFLKSLKSSLEKNEVVYCFVSLFYYLIVLIDAGYEGVLFLFCHNQIIVRSLWITVLFACFICMFTILPSCSANTQRLGLWLYFLHSLLTTIFSDFLSYIIRVIYLSIYDCYISLMN